MAAAERVCSSHLAGPVSLGQVAPAGTSEHSRTCREKIHSKGGSGWWDAGRTGKNLGETSLPFWHPHPSVAARPGAWGCLTAD